MIKRGNSTVDFDCLNEVPQVGVDTKGKINRGGVFGKIVDIAFGRKNINM